MKKYCLVLFVFLGIFLYSQTIDVNQIKNPRDNGGWVTQIGNYVSDEDIATLNSIINQIEVETTAEIAVVILPSTGGDVFTFTQNLFDLWKIGKKDKNNGVLIVSSMDERVFRTHTGYGIEPVLTDGLTKILQERYVIPLYKEGKYGEAIIAYIKQLQTILNNPETKDEIVSDYSKSGKTEVTRDRVSKSDRLSREDGFNIILISIILTIIGIMTFLGQLKKTNDFSKKEYTRYSQIRELADKSISGPGAASIIFFIVTMILNLAGQTSYFFYINILFLFFSIGGIAVSVFIIMKNSKRKESIINKWRTSPRTCPECGNIMNKLSEKEDNKYLNGIQNAEEKVRSYDYDVWLCSSCPNKTIEQFRDRNYSFYTVCSNCKGLTLKQTESVIISHPTYTRSGEKKLIFRCESCNNEFYKYITLPRLERSSSSYSSSSGGFGHSSSGSGGFSGGGSFGGGSSGGGGSSSSW